jgi:hypothetical protein
MGTQGAPPGSYQLPDSLGAQASSLKRSSPSFSMPRVQRLRNDYEKLSKSMPSVGQYEVRVSIGKQALSGSKTLPSYAFGSSTWEKEGKRFLTLGHANKTLLGTASPGNYDHQHSNNFSSIGVQGLSHRHSSPTHRFGTGPKLIFKPNDTPGPGRCYLWAICGWEEEPCIGWVAVSHDGLGVQVNHLVIRMRL